MPSRNPRYRPWATASPTRAVMVAETRNSPTRILTSMVMARHTSSQH